MGRAASNTHRASLRQERGSSKTWKRQLNALLPSHPSTVCVWLDKPLQTEAHLPSAYAIAGLVGVNRLMGGLDGRFFLTGGADQLIKLWCWDDKPNVKCVKQFTGHTGTVRAITVCSSDVFLSASNDQ